MWPLCREGPSAKGPLPSAHGKYARQVWKNFPSSGVLSFAKRSCTGCSAKNFFKKNNKKPSLPTAFARGSQHRIFFKKIEKQHLPGALGTGFFFKKIEKPSLPTAFARGARHKLFFLKKIKTPSLPTARPRGRRQRRFQKPST
jgi:hypothetical protein